MFLLEYNYKEVTTDSFQLSSFSRKLVSNMINITFHLSTVYMEHAMCMRRHNVRFTGSMFLCRHIFLNCYSLCRAEAETIRRWWSERTWAF